MIKLYIDAAFHQVTKKSGIGMLYIENKQQKQFFTSGPSFKDNHQAELYATIKALEWLLEMQKQSELIFLFSDSQLVVDTLAKHYVKQVVYQSLAERLFELQNQFLQLYVEWLPDQQNRGADRLARQGLALAMKRNKEEMRDKK